MDKLFALLLVIVLAPAISCALVQAFGIVMQMTIGAFVITLPWLLLFLLVIALGAGVGAGLTLRERLPPRPTNEIPPPAGTVIPVRRAPQIQHEESDEEGLR